MLDEARELGSILEPTWLDSTEGLLEGGDPLVAAIGHARIGHDGLLHADHVALERIRRLGVRAAMLGVRNAPAIHYTWDPIRWEGIAKHCRSYRGQFPHHADCSAFASWDLWDATRGYLVGDFINGTGWQSGHTGTLVKHGRKVSLSNLHLLDLVFYGDEGWRPEHVAVYVGGGKVVSFGSEPGPFLLNVRYRTDVGLWAPRRYIVAA